MTNIRFACSNLLFALAGIDFDEMCRFLAELGYTGLELVPFTIVPTDSGLKQVRALTQDQAGKLKKRIEAQNLTVTGFQQIFSGLSPTVCSMTSPDFENDVATEELKRLIRICGWLGGKNVGIGSPAHRVVSASVSDAYRNFIARIRSCISWLETTGINLLIEPLGPKDFISSPLEALLMIKEIEHPQVAYLYDSAAAATQHGGPVGVLQQLGGLPAHVHLRELNGDAPCAGEIDYRGILAELLSGGYAGWIVVEPVVIGTPRKPHAHATSAIRHLKTCVSCHLTRIAASDC